MPRGKTEPPSVPDDLNTHESTSLPSKEKLSWRRPVIGLAAIVLMLAVVAAFIWNWVRPLGVQFSPPVKTNAVRHPTPVLMLSPLLICTGVDAKGIPIGASYSFSQEQVRNTGIMAFLTYSGAVPQLSAFQIRWTVGDKSYESAVHSFERETDFLLVNLGKELPAGNHKVEFLVDGLVRRSASIVIQSDPRPVRISPKRKLEPAGPVQTISPAVSIESIEVLSSSPPEPPPDSGKKEKEPAQVEKQAPAPIANVLYKATHWHGIGGCTGELKLTPQTFEFTSEQHTLKFDLEDVQIDGDGVKDPSGKAWHFFIQGVNVEQLLGKWKYGGLFPGSRATEGSKIKSKESRLMSEHIYSAKHKHRLGSCSGELRLSPKEIEFSSSEHYFKYKIENVQIDGDGIIDNTTKSWHFVIPGESVRDLLRLWKNGEL